MQNYIKSTLSMSPVMPVLTINDIDNVEYLFEALLNGNLKVVEITLRTDCALKAIEIASKKFPSLKTGAGTCLLYTSPSPRDRLLSRMPSSA